MSKSKQPGDDAVRIQAYLEKLPAKGRAELQKLRKAIRAAAPRATESFGYGIPGFRLDGKMFLYYAAWKHHTSMYPMTDAVRRTHAVALKGYKTAKGTVQFPLDEPLPITLVKRLVRSRAAEVRAT